MPVGYLGAADTVNPKVWCYAVAFAAVAFMLPSTADQYQIPRLVLMGMLALALCLRGSARASSMEPYILAGLCGWGISAIFTQDYSYTLVGAWVCPFDSFIAVTVYAALAVGVARTGATVDDAAEAVTAASIPASAYAIFQKFFFMSDPFIPVLVDERARVVGPHGSPVYLGIVLALAVICAVHIFNKRRWLGAIALILAAPAIWWTGSRGPLLGAAAGVLVLMPARLRWLAVLAIPAYILHPRSGFIGNIAQNQLGSVSDLHRIELWRAAWPMFFEHPLTGTGPGTFAMAFREYITPGFVMAHQDPAVSQFHAHNQLLHIAITQGLAGLSGYLAVVYGMVRTIQGSRRAQLLLALVIAYAVPAGLNPAPHAAAMILALVFGAASSTTISHPWLRRTSYVHACLAAASLIVSLRVAIGDWQFMRAVKQRNFPMDVAVYLDRAAWWNPWETMISARRLYAIVMLANSMQRKDAVWLLDGCHKDAIKLLARHPRDSFAWEIYGKTILNSIQAGNPGDIGEAVRAFDEAQKLAPTFPPLMRRRFSVARYLGDRAGMRRAKANLHQADAWMRGGA